MKTILAVGSIAIDTVQTPNGLRDNLLGGSAVFFSLAASLFARVAMVGVVGKDYPKKGWQLFESRNINMDNVQVVPGKTFRWGAKYGHDFSYRNTLFTELGVFESFSPLIQDDENKSSLVYLGNIQPNLQLDVAQRMLSPEYIVSDTMNLWIDTCLDRLRKVVSLSNIFLLNQEEAIQLTGINEIPDAAAALHAAGPAVVIIKMGADGSFLSFKDSACYIPAYPVKTVVDPTGAGDSFAGGFVGYLANNDEADFIEAALAGTAMASYCVENFGAESLLSITRDGVNDRINTIRNLMLADKGA